MPFTFTFTGELDDLDALLARIRGEVSQLQALVEELRLSNQALQQAVESDGLSRLPANDKEPHHG